jgi:hypothetical protein
VDQLHKRGDIYADHRNNAVFLARDPATDVIVGAELKGTVETSDKRFAGLAPGSQKDLGGFRLGAVAKAKVIYLVESALDAISLFTLRRKAGEDDFAVVSTAGIRRSVPSFLDNLGENVRQFCAYDNDDVGNKAAKRIGLDRFSPSAKDWNDDLINQTRDDSSGDDTSAPTDPFNLDAGPSPTP